MNPIRIAIVHSYYSSDTPSGENVVVSAQADALSNAGFEVRLIAAHTDELATARTYPLRAAINVATGAGISPLDQLHEFEPDVVHVHNLFPNFSTRWLEEWHGPIVATLHNFRPICSAGTLFRDSHPCTLCPQKGSYNAVIHACYKDSRIATLPLAIRNASGVRGDKVLSRADRIIVLSDRAKLLYEQAGFQTRRLEILENFVDTTGFEPSLQPGNNWVYIGRLTDEKGILQLLDSWPANQQLLVYGDGPLQPAVKNHPARGVTYKGRVGRSEIPSILAQSKGLVFPSLWAEGAIPLTYIESLAAGRPVVAVAGNAAADDISSYDTGVVFPRWNDLSDALEQVEASFHSYSQRARDRYDSQFGIETWVERISKLYATVIQEG